MAEDLTKRTESIENAFREIGLYPDSLHWIDPTQGQEDEEDEGDTVDPDDERKGAKKTAHVLVSSWYLGDVAFTSRVQDPDQYDIDAEFRAMTSELRRDTFETNRDNIIDDLDKLTGEK